MSQAIIFMACRCRAFAVEMKAAALQRAAFGVRVNAVAPGPTKTGMLRTRDAHSREPGTPTQAGLTSFDSPAFVKARTLDFEASRASSCEEGHADSFRG